MNKIQRHLEDLEAESSTLTESYQTQIEQITRGQSQLRNDLRENKDMIESLALNIENADTTTSSTVAPITRPSRPYTVINRLIKNIHLESARNFSNVAEQWYEMSTRISTLEKTVRKTNCM